MFRTGHIIHHATFQESNMLPRLVSKKAQTEAPSFTTVEFGLVTGA